MKTVIEGVLAADLPWGLVAIGSVFACIIQLLGIPALPFAVGMYLPLSSTTPIFVGGMVSHFVEKRGDQQEIASRREKGVLLSSGLIAGEGMLGVVIAAYAFIMGSKPAGVGLHLGELASLVGFLLLIVFLVRKTKSAG
jgi:uncharacterized oligopeptide transporter (OPT) family protein